MGHTAWHHTPVNKRVGMVRLRVLHGKNTLPLEVDDTATILDVKQILSEAHLQGHPVSLGIKLIYKGKECPDEALVTEKIKDNAKVMLITPEDPAGEAAVAQISAKLAELGSQWQEVEAAGEDHQSDSLMPKLKMLEEMITQQLIALDGIQTQGLQARAMRKSEIELAHQIGKKVEDRLRALSDQ